MTASETGPSERPPSRRPLVATVEQATRLTPRMVRVVLGGDDLREFSASEFSDHYVKLQLPPAGAPYGPPFDVEQIRAELPREQWPRTRTLTVRSWDAEQHRMTIDFVDHGDSGIVGPWAASARPGDLIQVRGAGGGYTPDPSADWHLMIGDASVLPAIAASLARVPANALVHALIEVEDAGEELALETEGDLHLTWLRRGDRPGADDLLLEAVTALAFPEGRVHVFLHGEAEMVRGVRRHLVVDRGIAAEQMSASGYWKRSRTDEGWREDKAEWKRLVAEDERASR
ncbi:MAG TPA: siderophore-interacting protein [Solirubrobacteraceae bacterium]|nr:siderophore-interacting protein [Solirubrobacteraceae bacterium]